MGRISEVCRRARGEVHHADARVWLLCSYDLVMEPGPFRQEKDGSRTIVFLTGEFDLASRTTLRRQLAELTGDAVVDVSDVTFIDSTTVGVLVATHKRLDADGGSLRIRGPRDVPRRVLEVTGLSAWIED